MARKKHDLPGWFPFAIGAAAVTALFAGARSGWRLSGDQPAPPPEIGVKDWFAVGAFS